MPGLELSNSRWHATVRIVTTVSCMCVLAARLEHPGGEPPLHGARTAMGLIASASQRGALKRIPIDFSAHGEA